MTGCSRCIYLCDDGRDPEKAQYMQLKGQGYVYVAGRVRQPGEMNGKSGNLNNVLNQLYGDLPIPGNEILCILDADMVSQSPVFQIEALLEDLKIMCCSPPCTIS